MIREHFGQTALEIGHERGRTQPQAIDDEAMRLPFVMHVHFEWLVFQTPGFPVEPKIYKAWKMR
jgi:hypothetical protein